MITLVLIALIVLLVVGMGAAIYLNTQSEKKKRLMSVVGVTRADMKGKKSDPAAQRRAEIAKKLKGTGDDNPQKKKKGAVTLKDLIMQAGLEISETRYWVMAAIASVVSMMAAYTFGMSLLVVALIGVIGLLGLPRMVLKMMAGSRQKKFLEDFADSLDAMTRLLRAGMPVTEAIKMVAREYSGPVGEEMGRIFDQQKIGVPLAEAVLSGARRIPIPEMAMFATAVAIQSQTGSSLSDVLENLAAVIRARFRLKRKVQALSSEAKASAMIIGALPNLVATGLYFVNHDYIILLFTTSTGKTLLTGAVLWMCIGILVMRQMINFKV
jgi:tight adherence protein B